MPSDYAQTSEILKGTTSSLDIPEDLMDAAVLEFERVALWLAEGEALSDLNPHLYPQGSFRLGTPIRPLRGDEFDIDLVCLLKAEKDAITQAGLKGLVGDRLKDQDELRKRLSERRRCWTLSYRPRFHLDVLPSIPNVDSTETSILITDRKLSRWQFSNPIGYADWFFSRMRIAITEARKAVAKRTGVSIDEVPEWRVRTPLQRAVQLIKRHRDVRFSDSLELRPISIVITTLAGRAYRNQSDLASTVIDLATRMPLFIESRDGKWWVPNPSQPEENFADKWNENQATREAFLGWLEELRKDVESIADSATRVEAEASAGKKWGMREGARPDPETSVFVPEVEDLSHAIEPGWPDRIQYECSISAGLYPRLRQGKRLYALRRAAFKSGGIRFLATTNAPEPYEVKWQVTNTGTEALEAGQLRGDRFEDGEGRNGSIKWEKAAYAGTHFVEAFVIKGNDMVARSGRFQVRIPK